MGYLPKGIIIAILSSPSITSKKEIKLAKKVASILLGKYIKEKKSFLDYIPIASTYKIGMLGKDNYSLWKAIEESLLEVKQFESYGCLVKFSWKKGICKKFRFKQSLVYSTPELIDIETVRKKIKRNSLVIRKTGQILKELEFALSNEIEVEIYVNDYLCKKNSKGLCLKDEIGNAIKLNDKINVKKIRLNGTSYHQKLKDILLKKSSDETLVEWDSRKKKRYYLIKNFSIVQFIEDRISEKRFTYIATLSEFCLTDFSPFYDRNETNKRLDHNLTNLNSDFLHLFKLDGEKLVNLDVSNSQPNILGLISKKAFYKKLGYTKSKKKLSKIELKIKNRLTKPYYHSLFPESGENPYPYWDWGRLKWFVEVSGKGYFYEEIGKVFFGHKSIEQVTKKERKIIKGIIFRIFFDAYFMEFEDKKRFREILPEITFLIDGYKRQLYIDYYLPEYKRDKAKFEKKYKAKPGKVASNQFSIDLQTLESEIMIDKVLLKLVRKGYKVLSKHDSIICKESEKEAVKAVVCQVLDAELGTYQLKEEYY